MLRRSAEKRTIWDTVQWFLHGISRGTARKGSVIVLLLNGARKGGLGTKEAMKEPVCEIDRERTVARGGKMTKGAGRLTIASNFSAWHRGEQDWFCARSKVA